MAAQDGWELHDLRPQGTFHPEELAQRRENARKDGERRARLGEWQAALPAAEAAVAEREQELAAVKARLAEAQVAYDARYKRVVQGQALRDPVFGLPIVPQDDERVQPELGRRRLVEQELELARGEVTRATGWRDWLAAEIALIKGTVPWTAPAP